jgi:hypothetical protein
MRGDANSVRPEHAVEMLRLLLHAQLAVFPGGHGAYIGEVTGAQRENAQVRFGVAGSSLQKESKLLQARQERNLAQGIKTWLTSTYSALPPI